MAPCISFGEEYAKLMSRNPEGIYLSIPQRFSKLRPGSIGYFAKHGEWNEVTDLSQEGRAQKDGFTPINRAFDCEEAHGGHVEDQIFGKRVRELF
ncbi:uncharacterized protein P174DRAFT_439081 [Aspergillus novofumigatus IBT 16806]|uniref:Uncharacterized protein n=1 Tax=Aspergillus novofumigatus (strain IBT 16806) TaxID=1392255 RepID=A0A2I1CI37_ASPN1|nr:uncharacterized protein P174DRAFT_439081 [Aspergillus novofumigatus IBT 16806]PKX97288.1 hypothetical protein P174DRAFT_439081 [Aspergillus novofumigatus IBT 16806]